MDYKNLVLTNHAYHRSKDRSVNLDHIWQTVNRPSKKFKQEDENTKFIKTVKGRKIHVVANWLKKEKKWLVVSVWVRGEEDKVPLMWQLITLPFKICWWIIKTILAIIFGKKK